VWSSRYQSHRYVTLTPLSTPPPSTTPALSPSLPHRKQRWIRLTARLLFGGFFLTTFLLRRESPSRLDPPVNGPRLLGTEAVTPRLGGLPGINLAEANNNLDVTEHEGRFYLAFRNAPTHFASRDTHLYVVSSGDEQNWRFETVVKLGRDLREPRLLSFGGQLHLYFAVLGTSMLQFEPDKMMGLARKADGTWTEPRDVYRPGFIPWRTKLLGGRAYMASYGDGRHIYTRDNIPLEVHWLTSEDGWNWQPAVATHAAVLKGGGSEADFVEAPDGGIVAVVRNEAGDDGGWGSKVCKATASAPGVWGCKNDPRKFDSPLLFRHGQAIYLIARRHLRGDGAYDLGWRRLPHALQTLVYQLDYWRYPKRCALWRVDPQSLDVTWQLDLPSRGDTCFPAVQVEHGKEEGMVAVYNYSSPLDGPDVPWLTGQLGRTSIYRSLIQLDPRPISAVAR
jgi:hypothetical protein